MHFIVLYCQKNILLAVQGDIRSAILDCNNIFRILFSNNNNTEYMYILCKIDMPQRKKLLVASGLLASRTVDSPPQDSTVSTIYYFHS